MVVCGGSQPLVYERVSRSDLSIISAIELDPEQIRRFLGPLDDVVSAVLGGPAHALFAIKNNGTLIGFYVMHPDQRDAACWWLGWFALDRRAQGCGFGRATMRHILASTRQLVGCRRVRLLVCPDNASALRLYESAGFRSVGLGRTGELIFEIALSTLVALGAARLVTAAGHASHVGRLRSSAGPYAARMIGVQRGPPRLTVREAAMAGCARRVRRAALRHDRVAVRAHG